MTSSGVTRPELRVWAVLGVAALLFGAGLARAQPQPQAPFAPVSPVSPSPVSPPLRDGSGQQAPPADASESHINRERVAREPLASDKEAPELPLGESLEARLARITPPGVAPCRLHGSVPLPPHTVIACGPSGVWIVDLDASLGDRLIERRVLEGSAVGVFSRSGQVWVELLTSIARPIDVRAYMTPAVPTSPGGSSQFEDQDLVEARPLPAREPTPPPAPASVATPAARGRVLASHAGRVIIDLGRGRVSVGDRIEFGVMVEEESPLGSFQRRDVVAVGRVASVSDAQSLVELGVSEAVPVAADAVVTTRALTSSRIAPPRVAGIWTIAGVVRPFFVLDQLGAGALNELVVSYADERPLRYQVALSPLAFAFADEGNTFAALAIFSLSYDTRLFEIGLGLGFQTINDGDFDPGTGFSVSQSLRFGSIDGLNLCVRNDVSLFHSQFDYSAFSGQAQVPVAERGWVVVQGGGGTVGHAFIEIGGKALLTGNGAAGSVFLRGTIGYVTMNENRTLDELAVAPDPFSSVSVVPISYGGPLLGIGVEWRR